MRRFASTIDRLVAHLLRLRNRHFFVFDVFALLITPAAALMLRLESLEEALAFEASLVLVTASFLALKLIVFRQAGLYNRYWRYASIDEMARIIGAVLVGVALQALLFFLVLRPFGWIVPSFPRSIPFIEGLMVLILVGGSRYSVRMAQRLQQEVRPAGRVKRVLIVGAGKAGIMMVEEMRQHPKLGLHPVAFVDDDPEKQGVRIRGLDVVGRRNDLPSLVRQREIDLVVIAIPTATGASVREVLHICRKADVETKTVPSIYELLDDTVSITQLRDVQVEDLLRRSTVRGRMDQVAGLLQGRRVMVTGAGGSIGSELCRQILHLRPAQLVLLGHGETSIFQIEGELRRWLQDHGVDEHKPLLHSVIADVRDWHRLEQVFCLHRPEIVFHAAAHKHVSLMEDNLEDAVTNNVLGTRNMLTLAEQPFVERLILISTDKAVNPTSIMGVTKRIAEVLLHDAAEETGKALIAVRFGNVLGSRGSVLEIFREQLVSGGPLTVTDPQVERYFMTIPEAVHLVLQAAAMGSGSEIFVLDMGDPIRIVDLARDLIRLSGREEGRDIEIVFTGLRPGEKLHERLFAEEEHVEWTTHEKVMVCKNGVGRGEEEAERQGRTHRQALVEELLEAARQGHSTDIIRLMEKLVPTFNATPKVPAPADDLVTSTSAEE